MKTESEFQGEVFKCFILPNPLSKTQRYLKCPLTINKGKGKLQPENLYYNTELITANWLMVSLKLYKEVSF